MSRISMSAIRIVHGLLRVAGVYSGACCLRLFCISCLVFLLKLAHVLDTLLQGPQEERQKLVGLVMHVH